MRYLILLPLPFLAGCAAPDASGCGADPLASYIGQPVAGVAAIDTGGPVRVLRPDTAKNDDLRPDRLNILVDRQGRVADLRCG